MRFVALDSWRGICALLVVLFHFNDALSTSLGASLFIRNAYLFVDFFFVLSGFVLCHGYRDTISGKLDFGTFVVRRFARVWPVHAVVLGVLVTFIAIVSHMPHPADLSLTWRHDSYSIAAVLPSLALLNAFGFVGSVWNGPAWSIGAEFYVYLLFALTLILFSRRLVVACVVLSAAALAVIFWCAPDFMNSTWDYGAIRCVAGFFAGVVAYHCYERCRPREPVGATIVEVTAAMGGFVFVIYAGAGPNSVAATSLAAPFVFGAIVVIFACENGLLSLTLRARPFKALGRYSFSIYLVHQPLLIMFCYLAWLAGYHSDAFAARGGQSIQSPDLILADFVLAVVLIAAGVYRFVEVPARKYLNRFADESSGWARAPRSMQAPA